jgi:hypothetical protein
MLKKEEIPMKKVFMLMMALTIAALLMAGCAQSEGPSLTSGQTAPGIASASEQTSPGITSSPEQTNPGTTSSPQQTISSTASSPEQTYTATAATPAPTKSESAPAGSTGSIQVLVTDAPNHNISSVNLTVSKVEVHKAGGDETPGSWMSLNVTHDKPFNLLNLQNGLTMLLADGEIEAGKYTQLRMTVFEVIVDYDGFVGVEAEVPSNELKFVHPFTLAAGDNITLIIDIDAAKSVVVTGGGKQDKAKVLFKPVVKIQVVSGEGPGKSEPLVQNYSPADNATGVSLNTDLVLTFDEDMAKGVGNITIKRYAGGSTFETIDVTSVNVTISGNEVTIDPSGTFEDDTGYYVLIDEGALTDDEGDGYSGIDDKDAWNFTTAETAPLTIVSGALVADNSYIDVTFSEGVYGDSSGTIPVDPADFDLVFGQNGGNATDATISSVNNTSGGALTGGESVIRAYLSIDGTPSGVETIEIKPEASSIFDITGNAAAVTETTGTKLLNDQLAPTVQDYSPADNATGVSQNATLILNFNDYIVIGTGDITIKRYSDNWTFEVIDVTSGQVTISGTEVTIDPSGTLEDDTEYYVIIDDGALTDNAGDIYAGIANKDTWNFTT